MVDLSSLRIKPGILFGTSLIAALLLSGCPTFERLILTIDIKNKTGEVRYINVGSNDVTTETSDFVTVVKEFLLGTELDEEYARVNILSKELIEVDGRIDGVMRFSFEELAHAGFYQHTKRSPYFHCRQTEEGQAISGNGKNITDTLPGCMVWERKTKVLEMVIHGDDPSVITSFSELYAIWKKDGLADLEVQAVLEQQQTMANVGSSMDNLQDKLDAVMNETPSNDAETPAKNGGGE